MPITSIASHLEYFSQDIEQNHRDQLASVLEAAITRRFILDTAVSGKRTTVREIVAKLIDNVGQVGNVSDNENLEQNLQSIKLEELGRYIQLICEGQNAVPGKTLAIFGLRTVGNIS